MKTSRLKIVAALFFVLAVFSSQTVWSKPPDDNKNLQNQKQPPPANGGNDRDRGVGNDGYNGIFEKPPTPEEALEKYAKRIDNVNNGDPFVGNQDKLGEAKMIMDMPRTRVMVVIGDHGVGKEAFGQELAKKLGNVYQLDVGAIAGGTGLRGSLEARLEALFKNFTSDPSKILYIPNVDALMQVDGASGDLRRALKAGARVYLSMSNDVYAEHFEKDPQLSRDAKQVRLAKKTPEQLRNILLAHRTVVESQFRDVGLYTNTAAIDLLVKHMGNYFGAEGPDKALDILRTAFANRRREIVEGGTELANAQEKLEQLKLELFNLEEDNKRARGEENVRLEKLIEKFKAEVSIQESLVEKLNLTGPNAETYMKTRIAELQAKAAKPGLSPSDAADLKTVQIPALQERLNRYLRGERPDIRFIDTVEIDRAIAREMDMEVGALNKDSVENLRTLAARMMKRVIGQNPAIQAIVDKIKVRRTNMEALKEAVGRFLLMGSTGVGKTELAKALAIELFGDESALVRLDMDQFKDGGALQRLIGSTIAVDRGGTAGLLTEPVRRRSHRVILIDEIDKAHPEVWDMLMRVLDEGKMVDGRGRLIDFRHCIIILTTNIGFEYVINKNKMTLEEIVQKYSDQYDPQDSKRFMEELLKYKQGSPEFEQAVIRKILIKHHMRPEFMERLDAVIQMNKVSLEMATSIARIFVEAQKLHLETEKNIKFRYEERALVALARASVDEERGARIIKRKRFEYIVSQLAEYYLEGRLKAGDHVVMDFVETPGRGVEARGGQFVFYVEDPVTKEVIGELGSTRARYKDVVPARLFTQTELAAVDDAVKQFTEELAKRPNQMPDAAETVRAVVSGERTESRGAVKK